MILIDDRAGSKDLIHHPPLNILGSLCKLSGSGSGDTKSSADACFTGQGPEGPILIGIEVKALPDLISSIDSGRLQGTQIPAMLSSYDICYLVYYGVYRPHPGSGCLQIYRKSKTTDRYYWQDYSLGPSRPIPYTYHERFLASPSFLSTGVIPHRVSNIEECAYWIGNVLYPVWTKPYHLHRGMNAFDNSRGLGRIATRAKTPDTNGNGCNGSDREHALLVRRANIAKDLPGIGYERAMKVAAYFPSVHAMMTADISDWMLAGLGKVLARATYESIRERK